MLINLLAELLQLSRTKKINQKLISYLKFAY